MAKRLSARPMAKQGGWKCVAAWKGGARFFIREGITAGSMCMSKNADIYIADTSGPTPDTTEDGPILWGREKPVCIGWSCGTLMGYTQVLVERSKEREHSQVGLSRIEAVWLAENAGASIVIDNDAVEKMAAIAALYAASGRTA